MHVGPPYDPIDLKIIPLIPYYAALAVISAAFGVRTIMKGRRRNAKAAKILGTAYSFFAAMFGWLLAGLLQTYVDGEFRELYRLSLPAAYSALVAADFAILWFAREVFEVGRRSAAGFVVFFCVTLVLLNLDQNWYGVPTEAHEGQPDVRLLSNLFLLGGTLALYSYLIRALVGLRRKVDDPAAKLGFELIAGAFACGIAALTCIALDAVNIMLTGEGYSAFIFVGWGFVAFFMAFSYLGFDLPAWLRAWALRRAGLDDGRPKGKEP